jgi:hypothetical protein
MDSGRQALPHYLRRWVFRGHDGSETVRHLVQDANESYEDEDLVQTQTYVDDAITISNPRRCIYNAYLCYGPKRHNCARPCTFSVQRSYCCYGSTFSYVISKLGVNALLWRFVECPNEVPVLIDALNR